MDGTKTVAKLETDGLARPARNRRPIWWAVLIAGVAGAGASLWWMHARNVERLAAEERALHEAALKSLGATLCNRLRDGKFEDGIYFERYSKKGPEDFVPPLAAKFEALVEHVRAVPEIRFVSFTHCDVTADELTRARRALPGVEVNLMGFPPRRCARCDADLAPWAEGVREQACPKCRERYSF